MSKSKTKYVDGFVLLVPKDKTSEYKKIARSAEKIWMKHGALAYKECVGDDLNPEMGGCPFLPFPKMTKVKPDENIWFSYIEYKSKAHRDSVNKKVMKEMEATNKDNPDFMKDMPFNSKRMSYGGFKVEISE